MCVLLCLGSGAVNDNVREPVKLGTFGQHISSL